MMNLQRLFEELHRGILLNVWVQSHSSHSRRLLSGKPLWTADRQSIQQLRSLVFMSVVGREQTKEVEINEWIVDSNSKWMMVLLRKCLLPGNKRVSSIFLYPIRSLRWLWGSPGGGMWNPERVWERALRPRARRLHLRLLRRLRTGPEEDGLSRWVLPSTDHPCVGSVLQVKMFRAFSRWNRESITRHLILL